MLNWGGGKTLSCFSFNLIETGTDASFHHVFSQCYQSQGLDVNDGWYCGVINLLFLRNFIFLYK
jgi:hypothetical protein